MTKFSLVGNGPLQADGRERSPGLGGLYLLPSPGFSVVDVATGQVVAYQRPPGELEAEQRTARDRRARQRIEQLERLQLRPARELALDPSNAEAKRRLADIEAEIAGLRAELTNGG